MENVVTALTWVVAPVAVLLLLGAAAEVAARWTIRRSGYYVLPPGMRNHLSPDPAAFPNLERLVRFEVNREGERGDDVPRGEGLYRILVAGGSQPEGYLLDQKTNWPGALQVLLNRPEHLAALGAAHVHVGNIARSGVGSEALDLILERVLPRYPRLSAIVVLVGASDVLRWLEVGAPAAPPPPVRVSDVFRSHPEMSFRWRPRQLAVLEVVRRARHKWLRPVQVHERACRWIARARAMRARAAVVLHDTPDATPMLAHFDRHFRRLVERARAQADRVVVVRQPWFADARTAEELALMWHGGVGQAWQEDVTTFYSLEVLSDLMTQLDWKCAAIAQDLHVEQLDLMPVLDAGVHTFYDYFHATPAGARVIAAAVADMLLAPAAATIAPRPVATAAVPADSRHLVRRAS